MDVCLSVVVVFFFKQKTAYELRISDWSSDVCSSDLFGECSKYQAQLDWHHTRKAVEPHSWPTSVVASICVARSRPWPPSSAGMPAPKPPSAPRWCMYSPG